ncbi:diadenylate cyclase CdaA [Qingrenia yutianensis]|uniref:Diadenylate cyclase n=1 Tax=Qingrenia yutianensis TaxID=2763676 RepID=A0A926ITG0_9FIRM|nr:diadenylate cyclase CdaA [Qingrenia yutianensis]MBC8595693.1 TIGR00159 family protein [Qingrenia yutianensis]
MNSALTFLLENLKLIRIRDILDVAIVAFVIYKGTKLVRETRAVQLIKGIIILLLAMQVSGWLSLNAINFLLVNTVQVGMVALLVVFQPELRRALEKVGRSSIGKILNSSGSENGTTIANVVTAACAMQSTKTGALIVFEREIKLADVAKTGIAINSDVSPELIINIFVPNTPLHDGAVIIGGNKIKAAACFLPLTQDNTLNQELGTRHRAAIGITEVADCVVVVVSEETGRISLAVNGQINRNITADNLEKTLKSYLVEETNDLKASKDKLIDMVVKRK